MTEKLIDGRQMTWAFGKVVVCQVSPIWWTLTLTLTLPYSFIPFDYSKTLVATHGKLGVLCVTKVACDNTNNPYTVSGAHEDTPEHAWK